MRHDYNIKAIFPYRDQNHILNPCLIRLLWVSFLIWLDGSLPLLGNLQSSLISFTFHLSSPLGNTSSTFSDCSFPCYIIWKSWDPLKALFFVQESCLDKILIFDHLQKRGKLLVNRCFICKNGLETTDHLPLHCVIARNLWELAFSCLGLHWFMPGKWVISYRQRKVFREERPSLKSSAIPHTIFWQL